MAIALAISGGLDSLCAWYVLGRPQVLWMVGPGDSGSPARDAANAEFKAIQKLRGLCPELNAKMRVSVVDCRSFMRPGIYYFPREELICLAAWGAGFDHLMFGFCKEDRIDAGREKRRTQELRAVVPFQFEVSFPVNGMAKADLVAEALRLGAPAEMILATHSCVRASEPCGQCENCEQRQYALFVNGLIGASPH